MAKKILRVAGGIGSAFVGGLPGLAIYGGLGGFGGSKRKEPTGTGAPLPVGAVETDGTIIPVDAKRRRLKPLAPAPDNLLTPPSATSSTLGG